MKRLLRHFIQILILGALFFLMLKLPLYKMKYLSPVLTGLIIILIIVWCGVLFYKNRQFKILFFVLSLSFLSMKSALAIGECGGQDCCTIVKSYEQIGINAARSKGKSTDKSCDDGGLYEKARAGAIDYLDQQKKSFFTEWRKRDFFKEAIDRGEDITTKSYFESAKWREVMAKDGAGGTIACASLFLSMCSEYDRRHPSSVAKTVKFIMTTENKTFGCWPCKMSYIILTVIQKLSTDLSSSMQGAAKNALKIFILVWILFASMIAVTFPSKSGEFLKKVLTNFLWISLAFLILSSGSMLSQLYKSFLTPFVSLGLGFSDEINKAVYQIQESSITSNMTDILEKNFNLNNANRYCAEKESLGSGGENVNTFLNGTIPTLFDNYKQLQPTETSTLITPELEVNLLCFVEKMYNQFSPMVAVGQSLISFSRSSGMKKFGFQLPHFSMWFVGVSLWFFFTVMAFFVAYKIIDVFLRLGFTLVLMPLFVATAVFPATRFFTKKGFDFLLNIIVSFLGLTICTNFVIILIQTAYGQSDKMLNIMQRDYYQDYGKDLLNTLTGTQAGGFFWFLVGAFFLCCAIFKQADAILPGILGGNLGGKIGGSLVGGAIMAGVSQTYQKIGKPLAENASKMEPYKAPEKDKKLNDKQAEKENKNGNSNEQQTPAAKQNHFQPSSEKPGEKFHQGTQKAAEKIDNVGVRTGQFLQKAGNWAMAVPFVGWVGGAALKATGISLTYASKTLSTGARALGKTTATIAQTPGNIKNSKLAAAFKEGLQGKNKGK